MIDPASGPFLFDTSAESWLGQPGDSEFSGWIRAYLSHYPVHISAITVLERVRGYSLLWRRANEQRRENIESARIAYLSALGPVLPLDRAVAVVAGEIMSLLPNPPTPPRRSHRMIESRQERLAHWRLDTMIAATALVARMPLIHNNAADFETRAEHHRAVADAIPQLRPVGADPVRLPGMIGQTRLAQAPDFCIYWVFMRRRAYNSFRFWYWFSA